MNKKLPLLTMLIIIFITASIIPQTTANTSIVDASQPFRLFKFNTTTEIIIDSKVLPDEPLIPEISENIQGTLKFKFEKPPFFPEILIGTKIGNWIMYRDIQADMNATIKLIVDYNPDWCNVELDNTAFTIVNISTDYKEIDFNININLTNEALAFEEDNIIIKANFTPEANWGLIASGDSIKIPITVAYNPDIAYEIENHTIEIPPTKKTTIPIKITNKANGNTTVYFEIKDVPKDWNVTSNTSTINLLIGETKTAYLNVTSEKYFTNDTVEIELTPVSTKDKSLKGSSTSIVLL